MEFTAQEIMALRKKLELSREQLGAELGVAGFTIYRWENSLARPSQLAKRQLQRLMKKERN